MTIKLEYLITDWGNTLKTLLIDRRFGSTWAPSPTTLLLCDGLENYTIATDGRNAAYYDQVLFVSSKREANMKPEWIFYNAIRPTRQLQLRNIRTDAYDAFLKDKGFSQKEIEAWKVENFTHLHFSSSSSFFWTTPYTQKRTIYFSSPIVSFFSLRRIPEDLEIKGTLFCTREDTIKILLEREGLFEVHAPIKDMKLLESIKSNEKIRKIVLKSEQVTYKDVLYSLEWGAFFNIPIEISGVGKTKAIREFIDLFNKARWLEECDSRNLHEHLKEHMVLYNVLYYELKRLVRQGKFSKVPLHKERWWITIEEEEKKIHEKLI